MFGHNPPVLSVVAAAEDAEDERPSKRRKDDNELTSKQLLASESAGKNSKLLQSECRLGSVQELRKDVVVKSHSGQFPFSPFLCRR